MLDAIDAWVLAQPSLVDKRKRALLLVVRERQSLADALVRYLTTLGLERKARELPSLTMYLAQRPQDTGAQTAPQSAQRPAGEAQGAEREPSLCTPIRGGRSGRRRGGGAVTPACVDLAARFGARYRLRREADGVTWFACRYARARCLGRQDPLLLRHEDGRVRWRGGGRVRADGPRSHPIACRKPPPGRSRPLQFSLDGATARGRRYALRGPGWGGRRCRRQGGESCDR